MLVFVYMCSVCIYVYANFRATLLSVPSKDPKTNTKGASAAKGPQQPCEELRSLVSEAHVALAGSVQNLSGSTPKEPNMA